MVVLSGDKKASMHDSHVMFFCFGIGRMRTFVDWSNILFRSSMRQSEAGL